VAREYDGLADRADEAARMRRGISPALEDNSVEKPGSGRSEISQTPGFQVIA
jgi:hypothetical protein